MNYLQIYSDIIENARLESRKKLKRDNKNYVYYERHHILPRALDGGDKKENLVLLTGKEHFICHKLLFEIFPEEKSMSSAFFIMVFSKKRNRGYKIGAREYERIKKLFSEKQTGKGNHMFGRTFKQPKVTCPYCEKVGGISTMKTYHFDNCIENSKNNKEEILKQRRENCYITGKNQKRVICPHCEKVGGVSTMARYHFDNCKFNSKNDREEIERQRRENSVESSRRKPVLQFDKQDNFIAEYISASQAQKEIKISQSSISAVCRNKRKTTGGFIWKFK